MLTESEVSRLLDIAGLACHKGFVGDARKILNGVLAVKPDFAPAQISLAFSHIVVDDFGVAQEILNTVLHRNPQDTDALAMLGLSKILSGDADGAKEDFDRIPQDAAAAQMAHMLMSGS